MCLDETKGEVEEREFSVCFRPAWTLADVSGVLWLEFRLWQREELSEGRCWSCFLLMPISAALLLSIPGGHFLTQTVLSVRLFLAFSRSLARSWQESANPPGMMMMMMTTSL